MAALWEGGMAEWTCAGIHFCHSTWCMVHGAWCMLIYGMKGKSRRAQSWYGFLRSSLCPHASRGLLLAEPHP